MPRYKIESTGNGAFFTITRIADGATVHLQGDDAIAFSGKLKATHDGYTDDDLCDEYDSVLTKPTEHFPHDDCPKCGTKSVPYEGIPDQSLRGCPQCEHHWFEDLEENAKTK